MGIVLRAVVYDRQQGTLPKPEERVLVFTDTDDPTMKHRVMSGAAFRSAVDARYWAPLSAFDNALSRCG